MVASDPCKSIKILKVFCQSTRYFCFVFFFLFVFGSVNTKYLKTLQHIDDFGVSGAIDEISVQGCKLDFGPA